MNQIKRIPLDHVPHVIEWVVRGGDVVSLEQPYPYNRITLVIAGGALIRFTDATTDGCAMMHAPDNSPAWLALDLVEAFS